MLISIKIQHSSLIRNELTRCLYLVAECTENVNTACILTDSLAANTLVDVLSIKSIWHWDISFWSLKVNDHTVEKLNNNNNNNNNNNHAYND